MKKNFILMTIILLTSLLIFAVDHPAEYPADQFMQEFESFFTEPVMEAENVCLNFNRAMVFEYHMQSCNYSYENCIVTENIKETKVESIRQRVHPTSRAEFYNLTAVRFSNGYYNPYAELCDEPYRKKKG